MADNTNDDFLGQIADYLQTMGQGVSVPDDEHPVVDIFVGVQPNDPDDCIAIYGQPGIDKPHVNTPDIYYPRFQVVTRHTTYEGASAKIKAVRAELHDKYSLELPNWFCWFIQAEQEGYPIGQDEQGRYEFSINFSAQNRYVESTSE